MIQNISKKTGKLANFMHFSAILALFIVLSACVKNTNLVGYTFKNEKIEQVKVGKTPKTVVRMILGSPSVESNYGEDTWYYISTEYEAMAFFKPKIKNQKILAVVFNKNDRVKSIDEYSADDANDIALVKEFTETKGHNDGLLGQLLGNVGRFNSAPGRPKAGSKPRNVPR